MYSLMIPHPAEIEESAIFGYKFIFSKDIMISIGQYQAEVSAIGTTHGKILHLYMRNIEEVLSKNE